MGRYINSIAHIVLSRAIFNSENDHDKGDIICQYVNRYSGRADRMSIVSAAVQI